MEDNYISLVSGFVLDDSSRLSEDDLDDIHDLVDDEDEEEDEDEEDFYDFLPFQKEFLMPLRDRAFSWDVSLEDGLHGENMHLFAPSAFDNTNPKLVIKAKRMQAAKPEPEVIHSQLKETRRSNNVKGNHTTSKKKDNTFQNEYGLKNDNSSKLSLVLSKSNSSNYSLRNSHNISNIGGNNTSTALAMKPPTRLPSQGNSSAAAKSTAAAKTLSSAKYETQLNLPVQTTTANSYIMQLQQEQPQLVKHNAEIAQEIQALFSYANGDDDNDTLFDNSVRNLERIMMHPEETDEEHMQRIALEQQLSQQSRMLASTPSRNSSSNNLAGLINNNGNMTPQMKSSGTLSGAHTPQGHMTPSKRDDLSGSNYSSSRNVSSAGGGGSNNNSNNMGLMRPLVLDGFNSNQGGGGSSGPSPMHMQQQMRPHNIPSPFGTYNSGNSGSNNQLLSMNTSAMGMTGSLPSLTAGIIHSHSLGHTTGIVGGEYRVGAYTREERQMKIEAFRAKKRKRIWRKQIKYDCRKRLADTRPRVKGRFVSRKAGDDDMLCGFDDASDYLMGNHDGSGLNRHMLMDPMQLSGGGGNPGMMNGMMFMNGLSGGAGGLGGLGGAGMFSPNMGGYGAMNFGGNMLMEGLGAFPPLPVQQQPVRQGKKNRNNNNSSSKDPMNFQQIQQRYANAVYNGGNGNDLLFPTGNLSGLGGMDFMNNSHLLQSRANANSQMFMPMDFNGTGGLLGGLGSLNGDLNSSYSEQLSALQQQQFVLNQQMYMQGLGNFGNSASNMNGEPTDGFEMLQQQLLQQQQQQQHQSQNVSVAAEEGIPQKEGSQATLAAADSDVSATATAAVPIATSDQQTTEN